MSKYDFENLLIKNTISLLTAKWPISKNIKKEVEFQQEETLDSSNLWMRTKYRINARVTKR